MNGNSFPGIWAMQFRSCLFGLSVLSLLSLVFNPALPADAPTVTAAGPASVTPKMLKAKIDEVKATAEFDEATICAE